MNILSNTFKAFKRHKTLAKNTKTEHEKHWQ